MEIINWIREQVGTNQFFGGVIGASIIGGLMMWARQLSGTATTLFARYCTTSFSVTNEDPRVYAYVNDWLKTEGIHKSPRRVVVQRAIGGRNQPAESTSTANKEHTFLNELSDVDSYYGWYKFRPVHISFQKKELENGPVLRTVVLVFFFRGPAWLSKLTASFTRDATDHFKRVESLNVWTCNQWGTWSIKKMPFRQMDTLYLRPDLREKLVQDLHKFIGSQEKYERIGKPWRRNYLLTGPGGTGKTSLLWAVATLLKKDVYVFTDLGQLKSLPDAYDGIPQGSIIVYEDVDCIGVGVSERALEIDKDDVSEDKKGISMSQFLNTLDGALSIHNSIVFMTTNHPEKLDEAIVRKGRVDLRLEMGRITSEEAVQYIQQMQVELTPEVLAELALITRDGTVLPAELQELVYQQIF